MNQPRKRASRQAFGSLRYDPSHPFLGNSYTFPFSTLRVYYVGNTWPSVTFSSRRRAAMRYLRSLVNKNG